ncbi:DUF1697 domain-containing protein [Streptomyces pactum]|uniref:DUF1697 domain-containing protein n=1 Tax=Streptomyces pactum TaxID=68249 RepID=A0ABS0NGI6_9ACTN|nr:DUF1697 domain-containing protein [Streptomyces pactum]MBH5334303.1 DUF1697 domain-containing protein [Streptomyces pactum]
MTAQILLLRGINVGSHAPFPMDRQQEVMRRLGHQDVTVHLGTGNIVLHAPATPPAETARSAAEGIAAELGFPVPVLVRTRDELAAVVAANPYPRATAEPSTLHVVFLSEAPADTARLDAIDPAAHAPDRFRLIGREVYLWCPGGIGRSRLAAKITGIRLPGVTATARNWNTVTRLLALADRDRSA